MRERRRWRRLVAARDASRTTVGVHVLPVVDPNRGAPVIPVVTPEHMRAADAATTIPVEELIERAGAAVARAAVRMMGGTYGRRVVVLAGKGNNGADGRVAARRLADRGVQVTVLDAAEQPHTVPVCDLLIDAAYGTGFDGMSFGPDAGGTRGHAGAGGGHPVGGRWAHRCDERRGR